MLTGHEDPDSDANSIDYAALVKLGGTLVLLMGVSHLPRIIERLLRAGLAPETPAVSMRVGNDRSTSGWSRRPLATIAERAADLQTADHHRDRCGRGAGSALVQPHHVGEASLPYLPLCPSSVGQA